MTQDRNSATKSIESESRRLGLPPEVFVSPEKVYISDDHIVPTSILNLEDGVLVISDTEAQDSAVRAQGNSSGLFWRGSVPIDFQPDIPGVTRALILKACEDFGVKCVCSNGTGPRVVVEMGAPTIAASFADGFGRMNPARIVFKPGQETYWPTVAHELGHVIGLTHEQQRVDRDQYVRITKPGPQHNIVKGKMQTPFDFRSIMLYHCWDGVEPLDKNANPCEINGFVTGTVSVYDMMSAQAERGPADLSACAAGPTPSPSPSPTPNPNPGASPTPTPAPLPSPFPTPGPGATPGPLVQQHCDLRPLGDDVCIEFQYYAGYPIFCDEFQTVAAAIGSCPSAGSYGSCVFGEDYYGIPDYYWAFRFYNSSIHNPADDQYGCEVIGGRWVP